MTGCLKVAKNSIFTGANNVVVNTVMNTQTKFTSIIGFNKEVTKKLLEDYNLSDYEEMVKENYDGYRFYNKEMFCPWDVINFVAENYEHKLYGTESDIKPGNYWNATSSSKILQEYLGYLNKSIRESLQNLVDGKSAVIEGDFEPFIVHYAETFIIPASIKEYSIKPYDCDEVKVLKAYVRS